MLALLHDVAEIRRPTRLRRAAETAALEEVVLRELTDRLATGSSTRSPLDGTLASVRDFMTSPP